MKAGAGFKRACRMHGVPTSTGAAWRKRGERHRRQGRDNTPEAQLSEGADLLAAAIDGKAEHLSARAFEIGEGEMLCDKCRGPALSANQRLQHSRWWLGVRAREEYGEDAEAQRREDIQQYILSVRPHLTRDEYRALLKATKIAIGEELDLDEDYDPGEELEGMH